MDREANIFSNLRLFFAGKQKKVNNIFQKYGSGIWLSIVTCFMLFLYAPLELLFLNQDEFWYDAYQLIPIMFFVFVVTCTASITVFVLLRKWSQTLYRIGLAAYFTVMICSYIQGNFLTGSLPLLDGSTIDWSLYKAQNIQSYILWIIVAVIVTVIYRKGKPQFLEKMIGIVSICMTLMFCITVLTLGVSNHGFEKKLGLGMTNRNMFQMSGGQNLVILMLDAVNGYTMDEILRENPAYEDIFTDFTFYTNTMGVYPVTRNSVPFILSGDWFENEVEFKEYEAKAYAESPLLAFLEDEGWSVGIYDPGMLVDDEQKARFDNVLPSQRGFTSNLLFIKWQLQLTGFRYAPYCLKPYMFVNLKHLVWLKNPPDGETMFNATNDNFYNKVLTEEISYTDQKCFRFIHINGGHAPYIFNENVEEVSPEEGSYEDNLRASLTITAAYLNKLKEAGVYDNSAIIIMADHGSSTISMEYRNQQNPIFFAKGINENHALVRSDAPISYVDLQEAYVRLLEGTGGGQLFDWKSGDRRERRYLFYEGGEEDHMVEYMQPGRADDAEAMYETGRTYDR